MTKLKHQITVIPGDGIGPEAVAAAVVVLRRTPAWHCAWRSTRPARSISATSERPCPPPRWTPSARPVGPASGQRMARRSRRRSAYANTAGCLLGCLLSCARFGVLASGPCTRDLGGDAGTGAVTDAVLAALPG